jgi:MFS family permease
MKNFRNLLGYEPKVRPLLLAHLQSSLGTGAAYLALLLIAVERFESPFAVSAILLCELIPAMALGPFLGALADRWPRKRILVGADVLRAFAFLGLALADPFWATVAFALLAGLGQAAFNPAVMASLPQLVSRERIGSATGLYGAITELGYTAGPVLGAVGIALLSSEGVLLANAASFVVSAALLATLALGHARAEAGADTPRKPRLADAVKDGARALRDQPVARTVVLSSTAFVCFLGAVNVAEVLLVRDTLDGGATALALVIGAMGLGITIGSVLASREDGDGRLYVVGLLLCGLSMGACAVAPSWQVALGTFFVLGIGNGFAVVSENVVLQKLIPDELKGRVFGLKGSLISWAFAIAFFGAGALVALLGSRATFGVLAVGCLSVWAIARSALSKAGADPEGRRPLLSPDLGRPETAGV